MGLFGRLQAQIAAAAGANPQLVTPQGWQFNGVGTAFRENAQTYAASITPDLALGSYITVTITNNVAFTIQNPVFNGAALSATNVPLGALVLLSLINASGGATGAISLGTVWKGAGGFGNPANNQYVSALFVVRSATQLMALANWSTSAAF